MIAATAIVFLTGVRVASANLIITPYFDSSVTSAQQAEIMSVIEFYEASFADPINVSIEFSTVASGGGSSAAGNYLETPTQVMALMSADANAHRDNTAIHEALRYFLAGNTAQQYVLTSANCRALGGTACAGKISGTGSVVQSGLDGFVNIGASSYVNQQVIEHEIDEILGIGGAGSVVGVTSVINGLTTLRMLDPYRYAAPGRPSLTSSTSATAYLSFDGGVTNIANFNQSGFGDYGDFTISPCYAQSYGTCAPYEPVSLTSPEGITLQAIGYDAVPVVSNTSAPEPLTLSILGIGLAGLAGARSKGHRASGGALRGGLSGV